MPISLMPLAANFRSVLRSKSFIVLVSVVAVSLAGLFESRCASLMSGSIGDNADDVKTVVVNFANFLKIVSAHKKARRSRTGQVACVIGRNYDGP
jgi:hypothetical protein